MSDTPDIPPLPPLPDAVTRRSPNRYEPSESWARWMQGEIIADTGALHNPDHSHLAKADLAVLFTNAKNTRSGKRILGTAQEGEPSGETWSKGPRVQQLRRWYGDVPDFLMTLDARWIHEKAQAGEPRAVLALLEHELYHMAQDGFNRTSGLPKWTIRPHDSEQFVGVIRRYGPTSDTEREMQTAYAAEPEIGAAQVNGICGACKAAIS